MEPADDQMLDKIHRSPKGTVFFPDSFLSISNAKTVSKVLDLYRMIVEHRKMFTAVADVNYGNHSKDKIALVPPLDLLPA